MLTRQVAVWKQDILNRLSSLIEEYPVIAVADLQKVRSSQIQEIRKKLRGKAELIVAKNTILRKAAEKFDEKKRGISQFAKDLTGSGVLIFTEMNPFALIIFLNKNKVRVPAKAGDIATSDIVIPAGNTGLQPGPVISEFGEAKVLTRIEAGSIWVAKDSLVAEKGDVIPPKLASLLSKLGMKPMEAGLSIAHAYDEGLILTPNDLAMDLEKVRADLHTAFTEARSLAVEASYFTPETAPLILARAYRQAIHLSIEAEFPTRENVEQLLKQAYREMSAVSSAIATVNKEAAPPEVAGGQ